MVAKCPADNTALEEQDEFFDFSYFDPHKIGWLICGCAAAITCLFSLITILGHSRNYNRPLEQRQIIRVLLFPPVYAVVSFFSYRYFRYYEYWELAEAAYEAFAIAAFLMLMLQYIGTNVNEQKSVFAKKDKKPLPLPFCCWRYRPSKAYFLVLLKWSVVQYCIIRPAISIAGIVTEYYQVYCPSSYSYQYAYVYLTSVDFAAISIALYGLIVLYTLVKEDLKGKRPLAKFATIKLGIFLIFYQGFIFSLLEKYNVLHATQYWTKTNIANGLNSLCTSCEMVLISAMQMWAFFWGEYYIERVENPMGKANSKGKTNIFLSLIHALNFTDIFVELWWEIVFLFDRMRGKEYTRRDARFDFVQAFGAEDDDDDRNGLGGRSKPAGISQMELTQHDSHLEGQSQPPSSMMEDGTLVNRYDNEKYQNEKLHQKVEPQRGNEFQYNSINNGNEYQMQQVNHHNQNNNGIQYNHPEEEDQYLNNSAATAYTPSTATNQQHLLYPGYGGAGGGVTQQHHQEDNFDHGNQYYSNDYSGGHSRPTSWEPQAL